MFLSYTGEVTVSPFGVDVAVVFVVLTVGVYSV